MAPKIIAMLPLRKGSKGLPGKNYRDFFGKPLFIWQLEALDNCNEIDLIYVATNDSYIEDIINRLYKDSEKICIYRRTNENAQSDSDTEDVMLEMINNLGIDRDDLFILSQATNPFATSRDYSLSIQEFRRKEQKNFPRIPSMISVSKSSRFYWDGKNGTPLNYDPNNRKLRQFLENEYSVLIENGAFYIGRVREITRNKCRTNENVELYIMPEWKQYEIDTEMDLRIAEIVFMNNWSNH